MPAALTFFQFGKLLGRHIVKDECDAVFLALVRNAVVLLIIDLIRFTDLETVRAAVNHESYAVVGRYRHVNTMPNMK